ncbi:MAG: ROK family protein [Patescibacteria group bacterium]
MIIDKGQDWEKLYQKTKNKPREQEKINAIGLANLINVFNPEIIILGGAGAKIPKKELISPYLLWPKRQMPKIVLAKLGQNASAIGAALLMY